MSIKPIAYISSESFCRLFDGGNDSRGTVPVHSIQSATSKIPLYSQDAITELQAEVKRQSREINDLRYVRDSLVNSFESMKAERDRLQSCQMAWQPIETAPHGVWIVALRGSCIHPSGFWSVPMIYFDSHWLSADGTAWEPSHWTPLPDQNTPEQGQPQPTGEKPLPTMEDALAAGDAIIAAEQREWPVNPVCFECGHLFIEHKNAGVGCPVQTEGGK